MLTNRRLLLIAALVAVFVGYAILNGGSDSTIGTDQGETIGTTGTTAAVLDRGEAGASPADNTNSDQAEVFRFSDLPTVSLFELPVEALDTLDLIDTGGPYPFDRDDLVFQNREGILPDRERGHYREYTVITPGENDRGARRIVAGDDGERYYTSDHYSSFSEVLSD